MSFRIVGVRLFRPNFEKNKHGMCLHDVEYCTG